jgi:release factor glutamine methyltransferase
MDILHDYHGSSYLEIQGVYPVSEDTLVLLKAVEKVLVTGKGRIMDMGCGVGLISLRAVYCGWDVVAVDREPKALEGLRRNLALNGIRARLILSDLFRGVPRSYHGHFNLITFNPPYVEGHHRPIPSRDDLPLSGGIDGTEVAKRFIADCGDYLSENGNILLLGYSSWPVEEWVRGYPNLRTVKRIHSLDLDGEKITIYRIHRISGRIGEPLYSSENNSKAGGI